MCPTRVGVTLQCAVVLCSVLQNLAHHMSLPSEGGVRKGLEIRAFPWTEEWKEKPDPIPCELEPWIETDLVVEQGGHV